MNKIQKGQIIKGTGEQEMVFVQYDENHAATYDGRIYQKVATPTALCYKVEDGTLYERIKDDCTDEIVNSILTAQRYEWQEALKIAQNGVNTDTGKKLQTQIAKKAKILIRFESDFDLVKDFKVVVYENHVFVQFRPNYHWDLEQFLNLDFDDFTIRSMIANETIHR